MNGPRRVLGRLVGPLRRWLTRPGRLPRRLRAGVAFALAGGCLLMASAATGGAIGHTAIAATTAPAETAGGGPVAAPGAARTKSPFGPGAGNPSQSASTNPSVVAEGQGIFSEACASCHGMALQGRPGIAPSLLGVGAGPVDFYMSTGRMPLANPTQEPIRARPAFDAQRIAAVAAYVASFGGPPAPVAQPAKGSLSFGMQQFTLNCAGCHQIVGRGGLTVDAVVPDLQQATANQIAEAVRMGPYLMPHFDAKQISQYALDSIARYVIWTRHPSNAGGWGIYNLGPIPEGLVAWLLGLGSLVLVARLIGERTQT